MLAVVTTDQKGTIAELAIAHRAAALGIGVFKPLTDGERDDLVFDLRPRLIRVQCKTAALSGNVLVIRCYSCRRNADGLLKRPYTRDEIDAVAAYSAELDRCYFIPMARLNGQSSIQLRLRPSLNSQERGVHHASAFEFAATLNALQGP
jgi:hypothetical protein